MILVECHPKPEVALCDGPQALTMQEIDHLMARRGNCAACLRGKKGPC